MKNGLCRLLADIKNSYSYQFLPIKDFNYFGLEWIVIAFTINCLFYFIIGFKRNAFGVSFE